MQAAVNCWVREAMRNLVVGELRTLHSSSAKPYPFSNSIFPFIPTSTEPRNEFFAASAARYASARSKAGFVEPPCPYTHPEQWRMARRTRERNVEGRIGNQERMQSKILPNPIIRHSTQI